jgi:hypothetical protein
MSRIAALQPLVGRWSTTITMISPPKMSGTVFRAIDTYRWMPGGKILVHEVEARMGDTTTHSMEVYCVAGGQIVSRNFDSSGKVSDYKAAMTKGSWKVTGATERFASTRITRSTIEGVWQRKARRGWTDWMTVRLDRIS